MAMVVAMAVICAAPIVIALVVIAGWLVADRWDVDFLSRWRGGKWGVILSRVLPIAGVGLLLAEAVGMIYASVAGNQMIVLALAVLAVFTYVFTFSGVPVDDRWEDWFD